MFVFIFVTASLHIGAPFVWLQWVLFKVIGDATTLFILDTFKKKRK